MENSSEQWEIGAVVTDGVDGRDDVVDGEAIFELSINNPELVLEGAIEFMMLVEYMTLAIVEHAPAAEPSTPKVVSTPVLRYRIKSYPLMSHRLKLPFAIIPLCRDSSYYTSTYSTHDNETQQDDQSPKCFN